MKQEILENHGLEIYNSIEKKANQRIANSQRIDPMSVFLERFNQVDPLLIEVDEFEIVLKLSLNEFMAYILRQFIACPKS